MSLVSLGKLHWGFSDLCCCYLFILYICFFSVRDDSHLMYSTFKSSQQFQSLTMLDHVWFRVYTLLLFYEIICNHIGLLKEFAKNENSIVMYTWWTYISGDLRLKMYPFTFWCNKVYGISVYLSLYLCSTLCVEPGSDIQRAKPVYLSMTD